MATPPAAGEVLEVKRWKYDDPEYPARPVPDVPERFTVQCTYANRTVRVTGEDGAERFLTRTESNGDWREVCGAPNSQRLPCKGAPGRYCRTKHKAGLTLRENWPWPSP